MGKNVDEVEMTEEERALREVAVSKWQDFQEFGREDVENYREQMQQVYTEPARADLEADALSKSSRSYDQAIQNVMANQQQSGAAPGSGRWNANKEKALNSMASAGLQTRQNARSALQGQQTTALGNVSQLANGQETQALNNKADLASQAHQEATQDAVNSFNAKEQYKQLAGQAVGAGLQTWGPGGGGAAGTTGTIENPNEYMQQQIPSLMRTGN